ncbi:hypothetical protein [Pelagibacterium mangrovi]|uniref:hypothetical protein n=1 Tax=Pelagibacterium mangrovi TaxID=3119828 RepID=UPI002FCAF8A6
MIKTEHLRDLVIADMEALAVTDERSIMILAMGRAAQAALADEVERLASTGATPERIAAYRRERTDALNRWLEDQISGLPDGAVRSAHIAGDRRDHAAVAEVLAQIG